MTLQNINNKTATAAAEAVDTLSERERLIAEHMPQVRFIARKIHDRLPGHVQLEDLVSTGIVGLISAIDRYQPTQGVKLKTYAEYKIRGAILDSLRDLDWAPRKQRRRAKDIERAVAVVEQRMQRTPTEWDVARELGITVEEYREWAADTKTLSIGTLENTFSDDDRRSSMRQLPIQEELLPSSVLERSELEQLLARALERMPQPERTVLSLYYHEDLSLREIARVMQLHESRISQLKAQALGRLRAFLNTRWPQRGGEVRGRSL